MNKDSVPLPYAILIIILSSFIGIVILKLMNESWQGYITGGCASFGLSIALCKIANKIENRIKK